MNRCSVSARGLAAATSFRYACVTKMPTSTHDTLSRLERWCRESSLREKSLESFLLLDMFRHCLRYSDANATSQTGADEKRNGIADIALRLHIKEKSRWIIVEIKRPSVKLGDEAIKQAAGYLYSLGATRGIVTNGKTWFFVRIRPKLDSESIYFVDVLLKLDLDRNKPKQRQVLEAALLRCSKPNIEGFFQMLECFSELGKKGISDITRSKPRERGQCITALTTHIKQNRNIRINKDDARVMKIACGEIGVFEECVVAAYAEIRMMA
jgi:hypothetical protein